MGRFSRNWDNAVRFTLPDKDVFAIDANANPPADSSLVDSARSARYDRAAAGERPRAPIELVGVAGDAAAQGRGGVERQIAATRAGLPRSG